MSLIISEVTNTITVTGTQTNLTVQDTLAVPAGGDLSGSFPNPTVVKINGSSAEEYVSKNFNAMEVFRVVDDYFVGLGSTSTAVTGGGTALTGTTISPTGEIILDAGATSGAAATAYINCQFSAGFGVTEPKVVRGKFSTVSAGTHNANGFIFFGVSNVTPPANPILTASFAGFVLGGAQSATNWTVAYDSSATSATFVDTGVAAQDTDQLQILFSSTNARFYINNVLVYTRTFVSTESLGAARVQCTFRNLAANAAGNAAALDTLQFDIHY